VAFTLEEIPVSQRQLVSYCFYKIDPAWRLRSEEQRCEDKRAFGEAIDQFADDLLVRTYSTVGTRGDVDLLIWRATEDVGLLHQATAAVNRTSLAPFLTSPHHFLAMTRRSIYVTNHRHEGQEGTRTRIRPSDAPYLVVYPFVKTRPWYALSKEERQRMMDSHIEIGHKYPSVKLNTTYSFGLDDQEFVVAFETDSLPDFLDLVMELRETAASAYTLRDTPTFTCLRMDVREALDQIG
jgi:chlorite dismutase